MFSTDTQATDGRKDFCQVCNAIVGRLWRKKHSRRLKKYNAKYYRTHRRAIRARQELYNIKHPGVIRAHQLVSAALADGRLVKQPCEVCGTTLRVTSHHEDYRRPFVINWLCRSHHQRRHAQKEFAKRRINLNLQIRRINKKAA